MRFLTPGHPLEVEVGRLIVAGWTGRDQAAVDHHIEELAALGVARPSSTPLYYRVSTALLTQAPVIEVLGATSSGEAEPVLIEAGGTRWLGLGSDHTDRALEAMSVAWSKQACAKPLAEALWRFDEVAGHLDELLLRCEIEEKGAWVTYQEGPLAAIRPLAGLAEAAGMTGGDVMFCGTLGARGGVRPAGAYRMQMIDNRLKRTLHLAYRVRVLPVVA